MSSTIFLSAASLCYIFMLVIVYFTKERVNTSETRIFTRLLIISIISLISELYITIIPINMDIPLFVFLLKLYLILCVLWLSHFMEYVFIITRNDDERATINYKQSYKKVYRIFWGIIGLIMLVVILLPIYFFNEKGMKYSYGPSVDVVFALSGIFTFIMSFYIIKNIRRIKNKGYFPIIFLIILMAVVGVVQRINPALLLANTCFALITSLMYHTIENPDIKMVDELIKNRKIIERTSEEKSLFLFKMSQEMKQPIHCINKEIDIYKNSKLTKEQNDSLINNISINNRKMNYLINEVLGITNYDNKNIKVFENTYDICSLLKEIEKRIKAVNKKNIDLKFDYSSNVPDEIYGDSIKLKQVLMSVIMNSIENTNSGYIHVELSSITKYDVCRLVISIKDSGCGIELSTVNKILSNDKNLSEKEYEKLNSLDVDLLVASKILKMLNGTMYIQSELNKGTEVIITLDQKINQKLNIENISTIENYIKSRQFKKTILIVNDDDKESKKMKQLLENEGYDVNLSFHGNDCLTRIKNGEKYDLILIDDEMKTMNGLKIIKSLKDENDTSKKMIMLEKDKVFIGHHFVDEGFDDFIDKSNFLEEILKKY